MTNTQPTYFYYSVAGENIALNIITKIKLDEEVVTNILWDVAPFRCNVCGDVEELSYEEALEEAPNYDDSSLFINDNSKGWDEAASQLKALMIV